VRTRVFLMVAAVAAIAWLSTGLRAAREENRASAIVGDSSLPLGTRANRSSRLFERARRFNADTRPILLEAGVLRFVEAQRPRAVRLIRQVLQREPENVYAWNLLARVTERADPALAARARARVQALSPRVPEAR